MKATTSAVKERPINFRDREVEAILAGDMTQFRRPVMPSNSTVLGYPGRKLWGHLLWDGPTHVDPGPDPFGSPGYQYLHVAARIPGDDEIVQYRVRPIWEVGDRLWGREPFAARLDVDPLAEPDKARHYALYRADGEQLDEAHWHQYPDHWRPSTQMPRWASRLTLEITGIRVQRLHDTSEVDAVAEGFRASCLRYWQGFIRHEDGSRSAMDGGASPDGPPPEGMESAELQEHRTSALERFRMSWHAIHNEDRSWSSNPWAWIVEFQCLPAGR